MNLSVETLDNSTVIKVEGRLDTLTAPQLEAVVMALIEKSAINIIMDLSQMGYISSTGFRVLILGQKKVKPQGGQVILVGVNPEIQENFDISGFNQFFLFFSNLEVALTHF